MLTKISSKVTKNYMKRTSSVQHEDVTQLHLIDRINLHYKIGTHFMMPFTDEEITLRDAVGVAETFDDAIQCAIDIYNFEKREQEKEELQTPQEGNSSVGMTLILWSAQGEGDEVEEKENQSLKVTLTRQKVTKTKSLRKMKHQLLWVVMKVATYAKTDVS